MIGGFVWGGDYEGEVEPLGSVVPVNRGKRRADVNETAIARPRKLVKKTDITESSSSAPTLPNYPALILPNVPDSPPAVPQEITQKKIAKQRERVTSHTPTESPASVPQEIADDKIAEKRKRVKIPTPTESSASGLEEAKKKETAKKRKLVKKSISTVLIPSISQKITKRVTGAKSSTVAIAPVPTIPKNPAPAPPNVIDLAKEDSSSPSTTAPTAASFWSTVLEQPAVPTLTGASSSSGLVQQPPTLLVNQPSLVSSTLSTAPVLATPKDPAPAPQNVIDLTKEDSSFP